MKKDLILITAYTPDREREDLLSDLLKSINRDLFDVMISSHSSVSKEIIDNSDYFLFDKRNTLLYDMDHKLSFWFENEKFKIRSTEFKKYNHLIAAGSLILNGLSSAKGFGYKKVHFLEYDSLILDDSEFIENSYLLESHSVVWYKHPHFESTFSLMSFNIDKIDESWFSVGENIFYSFLLNSKTNTLESFTLQLIRKINDHYMKYHKCLDKKIKTCRYTSDDPDWSVVVGDLKDNQFVFFSYNKSETPNDFYIMLNESQIRKISNHKKNVWMTRYLGKIEEIESIKIIRNGKIIGEYDFKIMNKQKYISKNNITYGES